MHAGIGRAHARQPHARDGGDDDDRDVDDAGAGPANTTGVCPKKCERRGVYPCGADVVPRRHLHTRPSRSCAAATAAGEATAAVAVA